MALKTYIRTTHVFASIFLLVALTACSKVNVEEEVRNMINAECKLDKIGENKNLSIVEVKSSLDEFKKTMEEIQGRLKTQDQKDEFLIFYSAVRKQEEKCVNPVFNRENLEAAKFLLNANK